MNRRARKIIDKYCRISESYDGSTRSVDDQDALGTQTITERGHLVGLTFKDPFKSGWSKKVERPEFDLLVARAVAGESQGLWVYDLTRYTRKPHEGEPLLDLAANGFIVISEDGEYDLSRADGRKRFRDALTQAAYESDKIAERTKLGKKRKAELRGQSNAARRCFGTPGWQMRPNGWVRDGTPPTAVPASQVEAEREAIRYVVRQIILVGKGGTAEAARYLNAAGLRTVRGNVFRPGNVAEMLAVPALAGFVVYDGDIVEGKRLEGEAVLDVAEWQALQMYFAGRQRGPQTHRYLLSGIMHCGECGKVMSARPVANVKPYVEDGAIGREYLCHAEVGRGGCARTAIDQRYADTLVGAMTVTRLADPRHAAILAARTTEAARKGDQRATLVKSIRDKERAIVDATRRGAEKGWTFERIAAFCEPTERQVETLKSQLRALGKPLSAAEFAAVDASARWLAAGGPLPGHPWPAGDCNEWTDLPVLRRMVAEAFPRLAVRRGADGRGRGELRADRFLWDGAGS